MWAGRIGRKFGWADESLASIDRADFHKIAKSIGLSRSYCNASSREVSWRYARGEWFQRPNYTSAESQEKRESNWDKEAARYAAELREKARVKHAYEEMSTGFCAVCGEREYARVSETSCGTTVWRRVHNNPVMNDVRHLFEAGELDPVSRRFGKQVCSGSGWSAPWTKFIPGERIFCFECGQKVSILLDGRTRRHYL